MDLLLLSAKSLAEESPAPRLGWGIMFYLAIVWIVIAAFAFFARKGFSPRFFTTKPAQWAEQGYLFIEGMCVNVIGSNGRRYVPMVMSIWMVVFVSNFLGLILPYTPSADWSLNLGLAIMVWFYVQWEGMRSHYDHLKAHGENPAIGVVKSFFLYLRHFAGPNLGCVALIPISILLFFIEIISDVLRILTLSIRLYGNIHGGHEVRHSLDNLIAPVALFGGHVMIPMGIFILPIEFLVAIIQAMVFTVLICVYLALATPHEGDGEPENAEHSATTNASAAMAH